MKKLFIWCIILLAVLVALIEWLVRSSEESEDKAPDGVSIKGWPWRGP